MAIFMNICETCKGRDLCPAQEKEKRINCPTELYQKYRGNYEWEPWEWTKPPQVNKCRSIITKGVEIEVPPDELEGWMWRRQQETELEPCPFCGKPPMVIGDYLNAYIKCENCKFITRPTVSYTFEELKKQWNKRS